MSDSLPEVSVEELASRDRAMILDVREPAEYADSHVPGAVPMPMGQVPARMSELDKDAPVYVICASGNRSSAITELLRSNGYDAHNVAGGTKAWISSGRPVEKGNK